MLTDSFQNMYNIATPYRLLSGYQRYGHNLRYRSPLPVHDPGAASGDSPRVFTILTTRRHTNSQLCGFCVVQVYVRDREK